MITILIVNHAQKSSFAAQPILQIRIVIIYDEAPLQSARETSFRTPRTGHSQNSAQRTAGYDGRKQADMSDATPPRYDYHPQRICRRTACTSMPTDNAQPGETLRVEIDADTLLRLMRSGELCAAELRCLDRDSHATLRRLCLQACMHPFCQRARHPPVAPSNTALPGDAETEPACPSR